MMRTSSVSMTASSIFPKDFSFPADLNLTGCLRRGSYAVCPNCRRLNCARTSSSILAVSRSSIVVPFQICPSLRKLCAVFRDVLNVHCSLPIPIPMLATFTLLSLQRDVDTLQRARCSWYGGISVLCVSFDVFNTLVTSALSCLHPRGAVCCLSSRARRG